MDDGNKTTSVELSIVATLYNSASYIEEFYSRIGRCADERFGSWELVLVDDGSPDDSAVIVRRIVSADPRVKLVELSRNFGHHQAIMAGLGQTRGEQVFLIDIDLEEQPEWLVRFADELDATGADVVFGKQYVRHDRWAKRILSSLFYKSFDFLSEVSIDHHACTVRLMRRDYVDALLKLSDRALFLGGTFRWIGYDHRALVVEKLPRKTASNYSLRAKLALFSNAITSFSAYPLQMIFACGMTMTALSGIIGLIMVIRRLMAPQNTLAGWSSIMISIWFLAGVIIAFIGMIGLYLSKIYMEVKPRPPFIVKQIVSTNVDEVALKLRKSSENTDELGTAQCDEWQFRYSTRRSA